MANGIRTVFNKEHSSKFRVGSQVRQTPEESRRTYRPKNYGNNNKDEDTSPKTLNDKKILPLWVKVNIGVMAIKRYIKFCKAPSLTNWWFSSKSRTLIEVGSLASLQ